MVKKWNTASQTDERTYLNKAEVTARETVSQTSSGEYYRTENQDEDRKKETVYDDDWQIYCCRKCPWGLASAYLLRAA